MVGTRPRVGSRFIVIAVAGAWLALASSSSADSSPAVLGNPVVDQAARSAAGVRQYWTAARMKSALPVTLHKGRATASATSAPEARSAARNRTSATRVPHIRSRGTRVHGKVFFSASVYDYQCSGTAVKSPSRSLVFTAGHCGYLLNAPGLGNAIHNWEFVPAYKRGKAPFGKWPAKSLAAPQGWLASTLPPVIGPTGEPLGGDSRYDVGAAIVAKRHHRTLQRVVGGRRLGFEERRGQQYDAIGYPAEAPFHGQREFGCSSGFKGSDESFDPPQPISISCDMTGGSSGGGWLDGQGRLVSVTSYGYSDQPGVLYGPYFGAAIRDFYRSVRTG